MVGQKEKAFTAILCLQSDRLIKSKWRKTCQKSIVVVVVVIMKHYPLLSSTSIASTAAVCTRNRVSAISQTFSSIPNFCGCKDFFGFIEHCTPTHSWV